MTSNLTPTTITSDRLLRDDSASLRNLAAQKEQEWREAQELQTRTLEEAAKKNERLLNEERLRFQTLKEDFKYNLRLLAERDQELEHYDRVLAQLKAALQAKNAEVSELKICMDDLRKTSARETQARDELQRHYQQRSRERQQEIEQYKISKDAEMETEHSNLDSIKRNLQRQLREAEEELDIQRQELSMGFDEALRRRENEYRTHIDEMNATVLAHEMKVKLLSKEMELVRTANERASSQLGDADSTVQELQKHLKQKEWELHDQTGLKDARIAELESQKDSMEQSLKRAMEDFNRKHADLDKYGREKETAILKLKDSHNEAERHLQDQIRALNAKMEAQEVEQRRLEWAHQDAIKEKDLLIDKLQQEMNDIRHHSDAQLASVSQDAVNKDLMNTGLRETQDKLKGELAQRQEDLERYKREISLAAEREANLERSRTQAELDWQRRCEDLERKQYRKSEELIQKLTTARDEALASVKEKEREISQREDYIRVLTTDRDHAFATLRKHNLQINRDIILSKEDSNVLGFASQQVKSLQEQNDMLRAVIHGMREDMERLGQGQQSANQNPDNVAKEDDGNTKPPITEDYVKILEKESRDLKLKVRELEERCATLQQASKDVCTNQDDPNQMTVSAVDNAYIRSHIQSLNDTIGALRSEKVALSAQLKRQQARIAHLENNMNLLQKQSYEKQTEIEQLQYELTTTARRYATETSSLRQRVAELELQLAETRKEADEYFKGGLQTNLEATALGNQVSALKMDLVSKQPAIGSSQPSLVYQLQEEVHSLRKQLAVAGGGNEDELVLKAKLKSAARQIGRLATERQQLIQLGNRLRSELAKYTGPVQGPRSSSRSKNGTAPSGLAREIGNKLGNLEELQYALTKQELQYAKRGLQRDQQTTEVIQVQLDSSSSESPENPEHEIRPVQPLPDRHTARPLVVQPQDHSPDTSSKDSVPLMMSSYGGESLQDVWQILDEGRSPTFMRSPTPQSLTYYGTDKFQPMPSITDHTLGHADGNLGVAGTSLQARPRQRQDNPSSKTASRDVGRPKHKKTPQKSKVRNYNMKDGPNR